MRTPGPRGVVRGPWRSPKPHEVVRYPYLEPRADREAVLLLESRNLAGPEVETRLLGLVARAMKVEPMPADDPCALDEADYQALAREFHIWLKEWREKARVAIKNRHYLIRLGLARFRKKPRAADSAEPVEGGGRPDGSPS